LHSRLAPNRIAFRGAEQQGRITMQVRQEYPTRSLNRIYYPEDRLPLVKLIPMGIQHVIAMFGGTVLAPILMGFDPRVTLFFSGIGTLLFVFITGLRVPSYLSSSFAFIGPILAITGGNASRIPYAWCGVAGAAVLYAVAAVATMRWGPSWIDRLMPPIVTGSVVAIIGLNLAGAAVSDAINNELAIKAASDWARVMIAAVTFLTAALVSIRLRGFLQMVPILIGVIVGCAVVAICGMWDPHSMARVEGAPWIGLPPFKRRHSTGARRRPSRPSLSCRSPRTRVTLPAISHYMGRDLNPYLGRAYLGDALATQVSSFGGTPQTTDEENMGVMAINGVFSTHNFIAAALIALLLGLCPKFAALM
jgi:putative pyrimidine permease RutG